jgi:hypothetical protein
VQFALNGELARRKDDGDGSAIHTTSTIVREAGECVNFFLVRSCIQCVVHVAALPLLTHRSIVGDRRCRR